MEPAMELLADTLINPRITPEEVEEQKAVSILVLPLRREKEW